MRTQSSKSPVIEALESRQLLSATATPSAAMALRDVLRVHSTAPAAGSTITITETANGTVDVDVSSVSKRGVTKHFTASYPKSLGFTKVRVLGGAGTDFITFVGVDENTPFSMDARVNGFAGNDQITTGAGNDIVRGGLGSDSIHGGAGNDELRGNQDNDDLYGEEGNDAVWGGMGDDYVNGGEGDDKLGGILGHNSMFGGEGIDTFVVQSIDANPDNDFNDATDILMIVTKKADDNAAGPAV